MPSNSYNSLSAWDDVPWSVSISFTMSTQEITWNSACATRFAEMVYSSTASDIELHNWPELLQSDIRMHHRNCPIRSIPMHYDIFLNIPMHISDLHPFYLQQGSWLTQGLVDHGLHAAHVWNIVPPGPGRECWSLSDTGSLAHLHQWTLPSQVSQPPTSPTLLSLCLCGPTWVACSAYRHQNLGRQIGEKGASGP